MEKGEQTMIGFALDGQIVEPVAAGKRRRVESALERPSGTEKGRAALTEQIGVMQLVDRVCEIEPPQQRIRRHLRGAQDVAAAVAFDFGEREQLAYAAIEIAPHPAVKRLKHPIDERAR